MTRKINSIVTPINRSGRQTRRPRRDQREPDPAPVVIVRAASVAATPRTPIQRVRRATARRRATEATDAARRAWPEPYDLALRPPILAIPQADRILREAPCHRRQPADRRDRGRP